MLTILRKLGKRREEHLQQIVVNDVNSCSTAEGHQKSTRWDIRSSLERTCDDGGGAVARSRNAPTSRSDVQRSCSALRKERSGLVLWRRPLATLHLCGRELIFILTENARRLWQMKMLVSTCLMFVFLVAILFNLEGSHQQFLESFRQQVMWCIYWLCLGVLSSVGLGTGLHTFLLYLGPHIASVTLAAYECGSLDFPRPPYPDEIICPEKGLLKLDLLPPVSLSSIMGKVRLEAFMWGAGTALGELPPYFMARTARLSGIDDEEDLEEFEELNHQIPEKMSTVNKIKLAIQKLVERAGFFGILVCASVPNPLFDLAGITCGHFLVPFWTFFGATLIGKAIIKMHIQKLFVIVAFNEAFVEKVANVTELVPYIGKALQQPIREFLRSQKTKLHRKPGTKSLIEESNWIGSIFEKLIIVMVSYFLVSIINSLAQRYHKRLFLRPEVGLSGMKKKYRD